MSKITQNDLIAYVYSCIYKERQKYDRIVNEEYLHTIAKRWALEEGNEELKRYELLEKLCGGELKNKRILDMAAGCGSFVFQGLMKDYNVWGLEPEEWKLILHKMKIEANKYNPEWAERIKKGVGENLPFRNEDFDIVDSWQTFEHVQDISMCLNEFYRVLKPKGFAVIHAPNYFSFYESHYQIPYLPMIRGNAARLLIKIARRPTEGLSTYKTINKRQIRNEATALGFKTKNLKKLIVKEYFKEKYNTNNDALLSSFYQISNIKRLVTHLFRQERTIHLLLVKS